MQTKHGKHQQLMKFQIVLLCLFFLVELNATPFYFKSYDMEDGLSNNHVTCCVQDDYGFMWFGTRDGLNRFDSKKFYTFKSYSSEKGSLMSSYILDLAKSPTGQIWVSTNLGLQKYDYQTDSFTLIDFTKGINCYSLQFDQQGNLWMILNGYSLVKYNESQGMHLNYMYKGSDPITSFYITPQDQIWATTANGNVVFLDDDKNEFIALDIKNLDKNHPIDDMTAIWASPLDNILLIGTKDNGIKRIDIQTKTYKDILPQQKKSPLYTRNIIRMTKEKVWIGTFNGIYLYDIQNDTIMSIQQNKSDLYSLSSNAIKELYKDQEGGIWVCTDNGGISYSPPYSKFKRHYNIPGQRTLNGDIIHDICIDKNNNLWIGTEDAGLNKLNMKDHSYTSFNDMKGLSQNCIHGLASIDNHLWIGTHANGIDLMDIRTEKIIKHYTISVNPYANKNDIIVYLYKLQNNDLLVATALGVYQYNSQKDIFEQLSQFPNNCRIQTLFEDHDGVIWAGTSSKGLYYYNPATSQHGEFKLDTVNTSRTINNIYEDRKNNLWFATGDGIKIYDRSTQQTTKYDMQDGLPSNVIYRIEEDKKGNMWISTANGLARLNPKNHKIKVFKKEHGLTSNQFNYNSSLKTDNDKLYFGTLKGMISFQPNSIQEFSIQPKVYISQINYNDPDHNFLHQEAITFKKGITLEHNQSTFYIDYTSLSYQAPNLTQYAYCMEGLSSKWYHVVDENRLLDLVNQLLDFRKTEIEGYKLNFIHTDIIALMQETFERFHDTAEQEALQMIIECNVKSFYAFIDKEACTKILSNLLSNAIKYARSKIIVRFETQDGERFTIDIMNDGKPISEEIKEKIFEPFYRDDSSIHKSGTGLGLPLARSLAEMHEGSLTLEESPAGLIIFRLRLPVNQPNSLKLEEEKAEVLTNPASERKYVTQESRPTVLVVEDNTEMLHFIGQEINVHYNVVTAGNGEEAIARLQEYGIQLIISDIMMPVMDGFTLLKKIKTNLEFSHIPIILLTAKNTLQSRMEGLELGADAYIDKPFSMDLLLTQVTNLLNNRSNMRAYYFNSPIANIKSMAYTKADEKFLKKLNDIIDSHINDVNLDVDMIADLMNLSRPTLYRKINGLSNVTPNELIKISRLKKAAELILQGDMRIYEIAEAVGFNSQSYFSRAFSKQFNMSPSQYAKENNIELK